MHSVTFWRRVLGSARTLASTSLWRRYKRTAVQVKRHRSSIGAWITGNHYILPNFTTLNIKHARHHHHYPRTS